MDRARNKFLACSGFAGDENTGVSRSDLGHEGKYPLQRGRSSDDLIEQRRLIDFFAQSDVLVFQFLFGLFWIRDDHNGACHNLPPNLGTLHAY